MTTGERIIEAITDGVLMQGFCAHCKDHDIVTSFAVNAAEQLEAVVESGPDFEAMKRVMSNDAKRMNELQAQIDRLHTALDGAKTERDEARDTLAEGLTDAERIVEMTKADLAQLRAELAKVTKERDEARAEAISYRESTKTQLSRAIHARSMLIAIESDYDHPWPDEDAKTKEHREWVLSVIRATLKTE